MEDTSMNIFALKGHKVRCATFNAGYDAQREHAKQYLNIGQVYTVEKTEVDRSFTDVWLQEIPKVFFNSVFFEDVVPQSEEDDKKHPDYKRYH